MNPIDNIFKRRKALIAYLPAGYPSVQATLDLVPLLVRHGVDAIELGIPFSDPMADGTTIQHASQKALHNGVTPQTCLEIASALNKLVTVPLIFMSYINPLYQIGFDNFCRNSADAGISGLILPDVPPEESTEMEKYVNLNRLYLIYMAVPTSTSERLRMIGERAKGFVYMVALSGVTGARQAFPVSLERYVERMRRATDTPLCVGFGISTPEQAGYVAGMADGVIIGSRLIQLIDEDPGNGKLIEFIDSTRDCIDGAP